MDCNSKRGAGVIGGLIETVRALTSARGRAVVRSDFPLLGFLPPFLCGQLCGFAPAGVPLVVAFVLGAALVSGAVWGRAGLVTAGLGLGAGLVSALAVAPGPPQPPPRARSYLAVVVEEPRVPRTGAVRLTLAVVPREGGGGIEPVHVDCVAVDLPWRNIAGIERGDTIAFRGTFAPVRVGYNPFRYEATLARRGVGATCRMTHVSPVLSRSRTGIDRMRDNIERRIARVLGSGETAGLVAAMSIGARDTLSVETERAFKSTGLAHLLVVSGFQVTVVFHVVAAILRWCLGRFRFVLERVPVREVGALGGLVAALLFVAVSGLEGASLRAGLAAVFVVVAALLERRGGLPNAILVSLVGLATVWPGAYLEPGVQLTYAALLGIWLGRRERSAISSVSASVREGVRVTVAVWVWTTPVALAWFGSIAPLGLVLNPIVAPLASFVGCQGTFLGLGVHALGLDETGLVLRAVGATLRGVRDVVAWCAEWGGVEGEVDGPWRFGLMALLGAIALGGAFARCGRFLGARGAGPRNRIVRRSALC